LREMSVFATLQRLQRTHQTGEEGDDFLQSAAHCEEGVLCETVPWAPTNGPPGC
jgi:hypothetical protein